VDEQCQVLHERPVLLEDLALDETEDLCEGGRRCVQDSGL
jgi:hypothetical protein